MTEAELTAHLFIGGDALARLIRANWRTLDDEPLPADEVLKAAVHYLCWLIRARQGETLH